MSSSRRGCRPPHEYATRTTPNPNADLLLQVCRKGNSDILCELLQEPENAQVALSWEEWVYIEEEILDVERHEVRESKFNLQLMLQAAAKAGHAFVVRMLFEFATRSVVKRDYSYSRGDQLINGSTLDAVLKGNSTAVLEVFLDYDPNILNLSIGMGGDLLGASVGGPSSEPIPRVGHERMMEFLLSRGADPNKLAPFGSHPGKPGHYLYYAAWMAGVSVVELLLEYGAQISQSGAMHIAAEHNRLDVMELLQEHGTDVDERLEDWGPHTRGSRTRHRPRREIPLHTAIVHNQHAAAAWLMVHGADVLIRDANNDTALDVAADVGDAEMMKIVGAVDDDTTITGFMIVD